MIINKTYRRKTFTVQAIQVTDENMAGLAKWCNGDMVVTFPNPQHRAGRYRVGVVCVELVIGQIQGRVQKARAFPGDWITKVEDTESFKVYRDKSFLETFEEIRAEIEKREQVMALVKDLYETGFYDASDCNVVTDRIMNIFK